MIKFLGVHVQSNLKWNHHIQYVSNKISKGIGIINKVKHKFDINVLLQLYYAFVYPYINYCNIVWGNAGTCSISRIAVLQKRVFRIMHHLPPRSSVTELMKESGIFNSSQVYYYQLLVFVFKCIRGAMPSLFLSYFPQRNSIHLYSTRYSDHLNLERCRTEIRKKFVIYSGSFYFNIFMRMSSIELNQVNELSLYTFKRNSKLLIIQNSCFQ